MSFDAIEKYNTRLLIPKETAACSQPLQCFQMNAKMDDTKEHVLKESPLTSCVLFPCRLPGPIFISIVWVHFQPAWLAFEILKTFYF